MEVFTAAKQALFGAKCLEPHFAWQWKPLPPTWLVCLQQKMHSMFAWKPLGFFSKQLKPAQEKYSIFDRDLYACYMGIRHFHFMLKSRRFTI